MHQAELALVQGMEPVGHVLERMQRSGHGAIVVSMGSELSIVTVEEVLQLLRDQGPEARAELIRSMDKPLLVSRSTESADWMTRPDIRRGLFAALETGSSKHAILSVDSERALVATSDESLGRSFNMRIVVCRCANEPSRHVFQPHELLTPGKCNLDDAKVDCR